MERPQRERIMPTVKKQSAKQAVRVRFAPSPTGFLHIGGLRTALYNFLFARTHRGTFILRIEDTDRTRAVPGGIENIIRTLQWAGLAYDEGPLLDVENGKQILYEKGNFGPYIQSMRLPIYKKYSDELLERGSAYRCFCTPERLEEMRQGQMARKEPTMYDGRCRTLPRKESEALRRNNAPCVLRLAVPEEGSTELVDRIHGAVRFENRLIDDQVLLKSDGFPTYHLANVVDDHLMRITHVIRGEEWLPSTPKHLLLYRAFGWEPPEFAHLPLLLNADRSKLSKRQGDVAVEDYAKKGYLPETLINFVALLGWNPGSDREIYALSELVKDFSLERVNKSGAVFNVEKLDWLNGCYIRQLKPRDLVRQSLPYLLRAELIRKDGKHYVVHENGDVLPIKKLEAILAVEQARIARLSDIPHMTEFFFRMPPPTPDFISWKDTPLSVTKERLAHLSELLSSLPAKAFTEKQLEKRIKAWLEEKKFGTGEVLWPMRVALTGRAASPGPFAIAAILGKEETLRRISRVVDYLRTHG
jgi:glutamyl-tRNA synthetase